MIQMQLHIVPRLRQRSVAEVRRPAPHGAVQTTDHLRPRRLVPVPQSFPDRRLDGGDGLLRRPCSVVASAASTSVRRCSPGNRRDRKSTRLNSSHSSISYAVFCLKKKNKLDESPSEKEKKKRKEA